MADPQSHAAYQRRAAEVLEGVEFGPKQVLVATDAEILALDGPDQKSLTPLLSLGPTVSDQQRSLAVDEAAQRLFASGRTEGGTSLGGEDSDDAEPTARTVLRMRRSWLGVLLLDQQTAMGHQWVTVYLRADHRAMTEAVTTDGRHTFTVMKRAAALDAVTEDLFPFPDAADEDGEGETYAAQTWHEEAGEDLAEAKVVTVVVSKRHDGSMQDIVDRRLGVYNFADRTEVLWADDPQHVRIAPTSRRTLRRRLDDITRPLTAPDDNA